MPKPSPKKTRESVAPAQAKPAPSRPSLPVFRKPITPEQADQLMFPGDADRSRRLAAAFKAVRHHFGSLVREHSLTHAEQLEVLSGLFQAFDEHSLDGAHVPRLTETLARNLPTHAPEFWDRRDLNAKENAAQFTRRVYAKWLGKGLTRRDLNRLDNKLYRALSVWVHRHPSDAIEELPPLSEAMDELIERLSGELDIDQLRKLGYAIDARLRRANKS